MMKGQLLNERYRIKETIGGGGMANVYLAHDTILDRDVAIKVLRFEFANDDEFIARFDREAQSATSLSHPNIVNIYDVGEEDHILYMVMEYVDGMTLKEYIQQNGPLEVEEALDIMKQISSAIAHAHANNIVHRDIKPQNILIDRFGQVKVTDFGIAIALSATALTQTNSILGSVHYLSPEQARGGMATKKSDIYSLGIVLFELLVGRLPFSGQTPVAIALKHLQSDTPSVRKFNLAVPQSVENIVLQATAKDPFHRYGNMYEMEQALERALHPSNQEVDRFTPPVEAGEETKAIPIIRDDQFKLNKNDDTIVHTDDTTQMNSKEKKQSLEQQPKKKRRKWVWISAIIVSLAVIITAIIMVPTFLQPEEIEIPDVVGLTYEDALDALEELQLQGVEELMYSEEVDEGYVIKTSPKPGQKVEQNEEVTLFVSQGKETVTFDDYTGENFNQVKRILNNKGYEDIIAIEKHSDIPEGHIIAHIQPAPGDEVIPENIRVIFDVSIGPETISLINLKNMTEDEVKRYLNEHDLQMNKLTEHSDTVPEGEVIRHDPSPSAELNKGDTVDVYFSSGPEEKPISTVSETFVVQYILNQDDGETDTLPQQQVTIYIDDMNRDISHVARQELISEDKEFTIDLTIAPGEVASYKVVRDDEVVIEKTVQYKEGG
ncbi:Stk1 family PASTA domain-containing Ser/Thr kinase [Lentibacillus saliphilus]|uniref:Stk1 family PASTA domain-containing Ser/Thr kinase n=1 Tax=Lentibacillus saliphilus TaxID=2737028 RepID=UPI001C2F2C49|nr:Stk1 family PASTA domain-containing Ser/Thr kinase [Lentibacillus saliphilus]